MVYHLVKKKEKNKKKTSRDKAFIFYLETCYPAENYKPKIMNLTLSA